MKDEIILGAKNLKVKYNDTIVLDNVSLQVKRGEILGILGHNGAGKTTLLKAIVGILPLSHGSILLSSEHVEMLPVHERVKRGLIYVPEGMQVFPYMSVLENLEVAGCNNRHEIESRIEDVFHLFPDLKRETKKIAAYLSGGQQRMLVLARALMAKAKVLLLDDPFLGLTPKIIHRLARAISDISVRGCAIIIAGQHVKTILKLGNRIHLLVQGRVLLSGNPDEISNHPLLQKTLFGVEFTS